MIIPVRLCVIKIKKEKDSESSVQQFENVYEKLNESMLMTNYGDQ